VHTVWCPDGLLCNGNVEEYRIGAIWPKGKNDMLLIEGSEIEKCTECEQDKPIVVRLFKSLPMFTNPVAISLCSECAEKIGRAAQQHQRDREAKRQ